MVVRNIVRQSFQDLFITSGDNILDPESLKLSASLCGFVGEKAVHYHEMILSIEEQMTLMQLQNNKARRERNPKCGWVVCV